MAEVKKILPHVNIKTRKGSGKCPTVSDVSVHLDNVLVCEATGLGGEYTEKQVLQALRSKADQKRFSVKDAHLFQILCNL